MNPMLALAWANLDLVEEAEPELGVALADAGYWSEGNDRLATVDCELLIATRKDWKQRQAIRDQSAPRGRIPKGLSARERMERKLLTKRGKALYKKRGQTVEPVFGQMKGTQGADEFRMRGLELCDGEWNLHAVAHNLKKLQVECVRRGKKGAKWLH
ncbi:MAG: transposase [Magnetococcales bacterium]|nr:transposase [Magnetococcales bacterium]